MAANEKRIGRHQGITALRKSTIVMIGFAVLFGLLAVFVAQSWLTRQTELRLKNLEAQKKPIADADVSSSHRRRCVSATSSSSFAERNSVAGRRGARRRLRHITDVIDSSGRRVVLTAIEANEAILASKITGPGQRATLSATLQDGMRAVTIRVNDVEGVAGFVLPGDRVDVALTRQVDKLGAAPPRRGAAEHARFGDRPDRGRTQRQAVGRQGGDARGRQRRNRRRRSRSPLRSGR